MLMSAIGRAQGRGEATFLSLMKEIRKIVACFMERMDFVYGP